MAEIGKQMKSDINIMVLGIFTLEPQAKGKCEYCRNPSEDVYSFPCGTYEYPESCVICGKCIVENQKRNKGKFDSFDLPEPILPF